jgi:hypothetical protein
MSAATDRIQTAIDQVSQRIVEVTATYKPTYSVDGESYSHESYLTSLTNSLTALQTALQVLSGPFQKITRMKT